MITSVSVFSGRCPSFRQPPHGDSDGGPASSREDLHVQETHPLPQLDWHAHQRYTTARPRLHYIYSILFSEFSASGTIFTFF